MLSFIELGTQSLFEDLQLDNEVENGGSDGVQCARWLHYVTPFKVFKLVLFLSKLCLHIIEIVQQLYKAY